MPVQLAIFTTGLMTSQIAQLLMLKAAPSPSQMEETVSSPISQSKVASDTWMAALTEMVLSTQLSRPGSTSTVLSLHGASGLPLIS
jgi:hypothetical protein